MGMFDFIKDAGEALIGAVIGDAHASETLQKKVNGLNLGIEGLTASIDGDVVTLTGKVDTLEQAEKAILAAGNIKGVAKVNSELEIAQTELQSLFYTVKSGDTLSKIAQEVYGDAQRYPEIFNANRPMLSDPDKIYPGQSLRIPTEYDVEI